MISRAVVTLVTDSTKMQNVQVDLLDGEIADDVENFEHYGLTSRAAVGAEALYFSVGGIRGSGVVHAVADRATRPKGLAEGDTVLYSLSGSQVYLDAAGNITVKAKNGATQVYIDGTSGEVSLGASPTDFAALATLVKTEITKVRDTLNSLVTAFNTHVHVTTCSAGGGTAAATVAPATPPTTVSDVKATKVKVI
jgi:phage baseplate assembly protein V